MPSCQPAILPYSVRFAEALGTLCTQTPALHMCRAWLESDDEQLQEWVLEHMRVSWATGIGTIDTARLLAEQVEEGRPELVSAGVELLLRHIASSPLPMRKRGRRLTAISAPRGVRAADVADALAMDMAALAVDGALHLTAHFDFSAVQM